MTWRHPLQGASPLTTISAGRSDRYDEGRVLLFVTSDVEDSNVSLRVFTEMEREVE
jgi:hypothetical protein